MNAFMLLHDRLPGAGPVRGEAFRARCPVHGGRTLTLAVKQGDGGVLVHCHAGCPTADVVAAVGLTMRDLFLERPLRVVPTPVRPAPERVKPVPDAARLGMGRDLWRSAAPLGRTLGERYLHSRGVPRPRAAGDLRFHRDARAFGLRGPALVGRVSDAADAHRSIGAHVTWLSEAGGRPARRERRYVGSKAGGVVRLSPDEDVTTALGIGEGIETTLALHALASVPVWASMDAGNLETFPVLPGIDVLHVAVDRDRSGAGQRAALAVAQRWRVAGREVVLWAADEIGADLADVAQAQQAVA